MSAGNRRPRENQKKREFAVLAELDSQLGADWVRLVLRSLVE